MAAARWLIWLEDDSVELFDLSDDIGETRSLATAMPERTQEMLRELLAAEESIGSLREKGLEMTRRRMARE